MSEKEEFIELFKEKITRPGADALLNFWSIKATFSPHLPRRGIICPARAGCASTA